MNIILSVMQEYINKCNLNFMIGNRSSKHDRQERCLMRSGLFRNASTWYTSGRNGQNMMEVMGRVKECMDENRI